MNELTVSRETIQQNPIMSQSISTLVKAVVATILEIDGVEKGLTVGDEGAKSSYKAVGDKDVKNKVGKTMAKNGLSIFTISIEPRIIQGQITDKWGNQKLSTFTEVVTGYLLAHESGEYIRLMGYGHGTDPQDKSAGKATTYALKYTLLYNFLVATGEIDDTDTTHSEQSQSETKQTQKAQPQATTTAKEKKTVPLYKTKYQSEALTETWIKVVDALSTGEYNVGQVLKKYDVPSPLLNELNQIEKEAKEKALKGNG